jgi:hypothetical protein
MPADPQLDPTLEAKVPGPAQPPSTVSQIRPQNDTSIELTPPGRATSSALPRIQIPNYEILEEVARGGMGVVYRPGMPSSTAPLP